MKREPSFFSKPVVLFLALLPLLYLGKVFFFPNPLDRARARLSGLAAEASFTNTPAPLSIASRLNALKKAIEPALTIDVEEYVRSGSGEPIPAKDYTIKDLEGLAPVYFRAVKNAAISVREVKRSGPSSYQMVLVAEGKTQQGAFNDAYLVEVEFNSGDLIQRIKLLAPPSTHH